MPFEFARLRSVLAATALATLAPFTTGCGGDDSAAPGPTSTSSSSSSGSTTSSSSSGSTTSSSGTPAPTVACGPNTQLVDGKCIAAPPVCGEGTILSDGGLGCAVAPSPALKSARLTFLKVNRDLTKPALLNNHIPIRFGITANSADNTKPVTADVDVVFSFVNPTPADPAKPETCASNGIIARVTGDGNEVIFTGEIYPTDDCAWVKAPSTSANIAVEFGEASATFDAPAAVFSTANAGADNNKLCRTGGTKAAPTGAGCVTSLLLKPSGGVNVAIDSIEPTSSIGLVWPAAPAKDVPQGKTESERASIVVNGTFAFEGRDPYRHPVDTSKLSAALIAAEPTIVKDLKFGLSDADWDKLDELPGTATVTYEIAPTTLVSKTAWLPVRVDDPKAPNDSVHADQIDVTELVAGAENAFQHELYIEGATRTAVSPGGQWANESLFTVRACLKTSFAEVEQVGNLDTNDEVLGGDSTATNTDCRTFQVRLSRVAPPTGNASSHAFDANFDRTVGNPDRLALSGNLVSSSVLDLNGARTSTEGRCDLSGRIGRSNIAVSLFRVWGRGAAVVADPTQSYIDFGAEAFGNNVFTDARFGTEVTINVPFQIAKSFDFPVLQYGFGPVKVGISVGVGGTIGANPNLTVAGKQGGEPTVPALENATSSGSVIGTVGPVIALTGNVTGGIRVFVASAEVIATVRIIEIGFPHTSNLRWGVTEIVDNKVTKITVVGDASWDLTLRWLNVSVDVVGRIGPFRKTFNIWKYVTDPDTINLMTRAITPTVLE